MIRNIFFFILYLISLNSLCQDLEISIHDKKVGNFIALEKQLGSENLKNENNYISGLEVAQPIIFRRKETSIPDLKCYYFFYKSDSIIHHILYEWDDTSNKTEEQTVKSAAEIDAFIKQYKALHAHIKASYGESETEGDLTDLSKIRTGELNRTDNWKTDSTEVELYIILSSRFEKNGNITITPTYRIRLYIRNNKVKEPQSSISDGRKIDVSDETFKLFIAALKSKDFDEAKSSLSAAIVNSTSNQQLEILSQNLRLDDKLVIFFSGVQMGLDGKSFFMLQYQYKSDKKNPPKEIIKVLFDEEAKIIGIQPIRRQ